MSIEDPDAFLAAELDIDVAQLDEREPPWLSSLTSEHPQLGSAGRLFPGWSGDGFDSLESTVSFSVDGT